MNYDMLAKQLQARPPMLVEDLIAERSLNIVVGDSGLGKTPLVASMGIAIAGGGLPWLGFNTNPANVLYLDGECGATDFLQMIEALSKHAGLEEVPKSFIIGSNVFGPTSDEHDVYRRLESQVRAAQAKIVFVDTLRAYFPDAESKNDRAADIQRRLRGLSKDIGCAWVIVHHPKKSTFEHESLPSLGENPSEWLKRASGAGALITGADARIGVEAGSIYGADLTVAGYLRLRGKFGPIDVARRYDGEGAAVGYERHQRSLTFDEQIFFDALPDPFRFVDVEKAKGSGSGAKTLIARFIAVGRCRAEGQPGHTGRKYYKVSGSAPDRIM